MSYAAERMRLIRYLVKGFKVQRDDVGGAIGIRWTPPARTGLSFDGKAGDRLFDRGRFVHDGVFYWLRGSAHFMWADDGDGNAV